MDSIAPSLHAQIPSSVNMMFSMHEGGWFSRASIQNLLQYSLNQQQQALLEQIRQDCKSTLAFYIENIKVEQAKFPLLRITYSLWREGVYRSLLEKYEGNQRYLFNYLFFVYSERQLLPVFRDKVEEDMHLYRRGIDKINHSFEGLQKYSKDQEQVAQLALKLGEKVWLQELYLELLEDIVRVPYLPIVSPKTMITVREEYQTGYGNANNRKNPKFLYKIADKVGQNVFDKTLNTITSLMFSKTFVLQVNTVIGSFNPILMGATCGLSSYLKHRDAKKKQEGLIEEISKALELSQMKLEELMRIYRKMLNTILVILQEKKEPKTSQYWKSLNQLFRTVFEQNSLQIQTRIDSDGWEYVEIQERESFQEL